MQLHTMVTARAQTDPDAVAVCLKDERITYGALEDRSNRLAHLLKAAGCAKGDRIGLLLPKSIEALVAMVAALKLGSIYVPLDRMSPGARLAKIVDCCEPSCILAADSTADLLHDCLETLEIRNEISVGWVGLRTSHLFGTEFLWSDLAGMPGTSVESDTNSEDVAHILFTSGSTGTPKGVSITHGNVSHFIEWAVKYFGMSASDRVSCHSPLHFDLSTFDIWGAFGAGSQIHLIPYETGMLPQTMADFIRSNGVTQWCTVPSALRYLAQFDVVGYNDFPALKRILWAGEVLSMSTLRHWMERLPAVQFTNLYGPTETTISSSYYTVPRRPAADQTQIPIGTPCDGEELLVLDENLEPAAPGVTGDLYIGGVGLSPGYWRDQERTRSAFRDDARYGRVYKTGDLAMLGNDGLFYFMGRADSQIKSRGYRIELGEIEAALRQIDGLQDCAVVAVASDGFEGTSICCAYVCTIAEQFSSQDLRRHLAASLPPYMVPSQWKEYAALPLNANGKTDRRTLREQFAAQDGNELRSEPRFLEVRAAGASAGSARRG